MDISKYWKTVVDTLRDGVMVVDPGGQVLSMNPAAERLTGYRAGELIGRSCRMLDCTGCEIIGAGIGERWCSLFAKGDVRAKRCQIKNKEHRTVDIIKNASILRDGGGAIIGAVETFSDMSESVRQQTEILSLRKTLQMDKGYHGLIGKSQLMQNLIELIDNVALTDSPVMIRGESGTGKELVARAIHESSPRRQGPFIKVNCAALNENLLESELFGHIRGAYTGASQSRIGRFEAAHGGTIFLDEIGDIPLSTQVKLLRALEEKEIEKVGDNTAIGIDVRVISATNQNLERLIEAGRFREDLYFRINVFPILCPPLRRRKEDIPGIVQHFIGLNNARSGKRIAGLTPEAMQKMAAYPWPGNVRELRNAIEYTFVLCGTGCVGVDHLPPGIAAGLVDRNESARVETEKDLQDREALVRALRETGGNRTRAARILGVSRITVWNRIKKYGISLAPDFEKI